MNEHFKNQIEQGAKEMFFYGLEHPADAVGEIRIEIKRHKGSLDTFPTLEYVRHLSDGVPLFKALQ